MIWNEQGDGFGGRLRPACDAVADLLHISDSLGSDASGGAYAYSGESVIAPGELPPCDGFTKGSWWSVCVYSIGEP